MLKKLLKNTLLPLMVLCLLLTTTTTSVLSPIQVENTEIQTTPLNDEEDNHSIIGPN